MRELEQNLNLITDLEVKNEFEKFRNFEILNCEKIMPYFIKMANCAKKSSSLAKVKNDAGNEFQSKSERNEFMVSYYEKLYTKPADDPVSLNGCIDNFLGPTILTHPIISASKLTQSENAKL